MPLAQPRDESSSSDPPKHAELNPLLNPLLADNMGRWAEVYFTNPPEKRDQAVLDLLRELAAQNPGRQGASGEPAAQGQPEMVQCERCGRDNPVTHKFCGMCGGVMEARDSSRQESSAPNRYGSESEDASNRIFSAYEPAGTSTNSLSLFRSVAQKDYDDEEWDYEGRPARSYRFYIGAVLLVILLALGYTAWRRAQSSQNADEPSAAPPTATNATPPEATPPNATAAPPQPTNKSPDNAASPKALLAAASREKVGSDANSRATGKDKEPAPAESALQPNSTVGSGNGSEELATALRYLYGSNGQGQDKAEAVKWLWKSIAKHNSPATLVLADIYLKGDGVPKNCDQARVLLDSAARKGIAGAGERLRNLQAFGCQ